MRTSTLFVAATAVLTLATGVRGQDPGKDTDKIYLTDGGVVKDVGVTTEGVNEVEYRNGRNKATVKAEDVLRIEYGRKPKSVDQADTYAEQEGYVDAIAEMETYLGSVDGKPDKRYPWAAAYAQYRLVELNAIIGDLPALSAAADSVANKHGDSRYAPLAFVAKAQALLDAGKAAEAKAAVEGFGRFIEAKSLTGRWSVEQKLWSALTSGKTGKELEADLKAVGVDAAEYPSVRNRAEVAIGEALLGTKKVAEAEKVFREILRESKADSRTLAAAWTGLGDCLRTRGEAAEAADQPPLFREALIAYMRPVVVYPDEALYVAKAAFYAGRCYQLLGGPESIDRAKRLWRHVVVNFPRSRWEREARDFYAKA